MESGSGERRQEIIWNEGEIAWKSSLNLHHPHFIGRTNIHNISSCSTKLYFKIAEIRSHLMLTDKLLCTYMEPGLFSSLYKHTV